MFQQENVETWTHTQYGTCANENPICCILELLSCVKAYLFFEILENSLGLDTIFGTLLKSLWMNLCSFYWRTPWKRSWCWERLRAGGDRGDIGWGGWMASATQRTWVCTNSKRQRKAGKPGSLSDWTTTLENINCPSVIAFQSCESLVLGCFLVCALPGSCFTFSCSSGSGC